MMPARGRWLAAIVAATLSGSGAAPAQEVASAPGAELRALDKIAGLTSDVTIRRGESVAVFKLDVTLGDCRYPVDDPTSNAYAQLVIRDRGTVVFDGWMVASSPALSALDHPRYDIWVLRCTME